MSQKVLTLYDTLRELEGEFLVKYMQTMDEDSEAAIATVEEVDHDLSTAMIDDNETQYQQTLENDATTTNQVIKKEEQVVEEPAGWSMSLTPNGLSIQAVTRNLSEFNEFAKLISRQIIRDFGSDYLPRLWDPDAEGYFEEDYSDAEELDEDEYLVTVPVFSTCSLLFNGEKKPSTTRIKVEDSKEMMRTLLNGKDTLVSLIQSHYPHMLQHLSARYKWLEEEETIHAPHHLVILMFQLRSYLPSLDKLCHEDPLSQICILTAYVVSVTLLPTIKDLPSPPLPMSHWGNCAEYATMLVVDLILSQGDTIPTYPVILCCILLSWIDVIQDNKADVMIHMALRVLCGSHWQGQEPAWQMLIATLLYLDTYSATFRFKKPQLRGDDVNKLWKAANQMREPAKWNNSIREAGIVLESRLMYLLNKVVSLFYQVDDESTQVNVRKIDVDEVFALVRETELWEQDLPDWAKWKNDGETNAKQLHLKMHMHMIHNMVKILLFRPFCCKTAKPGVKEEKEEEGQEEDDDIEQTFTKTTFLDMSISSADRLTSCLCSLGSEEKEDDDDWTRAASNLVKDVSARVLKMFDKDEEVVNGLEKILDRLKASSCCNKKKK